MKVFQSLLPIVASVIASRFTAPRSSLQNHNPALQSGSGAGMGTTALGALASEVILNRFMGKRRGMIAGGVRMVAPVVIGALASRLLQRRARTTPTV